METQERRSVRRMPINLQLVVLATAPNGQEFYEVTNSINISSRGVYFPISQRVDDQREIEVSVIPPGDVAGMLHFRFKARGRVVRLESPETPDNSVCLAIKFTEPIQPV